MKDIDFIHAMRKCILTEEVLQEILFFPATQKQEKTRPSVGRRHIHDQLELRVLFSEDPEREGSELRLSQLCLTPAGVPHSTLVGDELVRHVSIRIGHDEILYIRGSSFIESIRLTGMEPLPGGEPGILVSALEKAAQGEISDPDHVRILLAMLVTLLDHALRSRDDWENPRHQADLIAAYIRANYYRSDLSIQEIADRTGISANYIQTVFRSRWNCTPIRYLNEFRLQTARSLLQKHQYQVKEVAAMCGWNYTHYFCRKYREKYGHAPTEEP